MNPWEEVKKRLDIVDVLSEYVRVTASGQNYRALSPFKKEKTPSLMISPGKQIWHDFSTGLGGDIFGFVAQIEGISKLEALRKLAKKAGVELKKPKEKTAEEIKKEEKETDILSKGFSTLEWTANLYHTILKKILTNPEHPVTQYCLSRGLSQKIINDFKIGYAPPQNFLLNFIQKNGINTEVNGKNIFLETRLLKLNSYNQIKDKFSDRLMIPIEDAESRVVGFTARVLPYDKTERPKYLNSSQSIWFDKSRLWFGLNKSRKNIIQQKTAILVEGNMDVVAAFGKNLDFTVASQGTSFTLDQLKILARVTKNIWLAFDNDEAGVEAGIKLFLQANTLGFNVQKLVIPENFKDLDEFLKSMKKDSVEPEELKTEPYLDYILNVKRDGLTSKNSLIQKEAVEKYLGILSVLDPITQDQYVQKLHNLTQISKSSLNYILNELVKKNRENRTRNFEGKADVDNLKNEGIGFSEVVKNTNFKIDHDLELTNLLQKTFAFYPEFLTLSDFDPLLLDKIYLLTQTETPFEEDTLADYLEEKLPELELIKEEVLNGGVENVESYLKFLLQSIISKLDLNASKYIFNPENRDLYMEVKGGV